MSREKQIEEMAKVMCGYYGTEKCYECRYCCDCHIKQEATRLYNAGYRKQSEGEWVLREGLNRLVRCTACGYEYNDLVECTNFCGNCGAKMEGGE